MRRPITLTVLFAASLAIAGCNASDIERASVGAVAGGLGTAVFGGSIVTGAVVGATAGALCDDVNLC